jgi:hypothetical protein
MNTEEKDKLTFGKKVKYSFYSAILFFFLSSPALYQFIQNFYGDKLNMSNNGCPNYNGMIVHTILYFIIILFLMILA